MFKTLLAVLFVIALFFVVPFNTFEEIKLTEDEVTIFVKGEVKEEGFFTLPPHTTIKEAIKKLPLTEDADIGALDLNNYLKNSDILTIPSKEAMACVSINTADEQLLATLPGVGHATAQKIIAYRTLNGTFTFLEDLMSVKGIGPAKYEKLKDSICL